MCYNPKCNCGGCGDFCEETPAWNSVEQAVNDVWSTKQGHITQLVERAEQAEENSEASATASAGSAAEAKEFRDQAETAAVTSMQALNTINEAAISIQDSVEAIEQAADHVETAIAGVAVRTWFYTVETEGQTQITIPDSMKVLSVQYIVIEGSRQDLGRGFEFDKLTGVVTLAEPLPKDIEVTLVLGAYNADHPHDFTHTLASAGGAALVGAKSGLTVQGELDKLADPAGATLYPALQFARWRDEGDIRGWGAKIDGTTDDTVAINTAIAQSMVVKFPEPAPGKFSLISDTILIPDNLVLIGPGKGIIAVKCAPSMSPNKHAFVTANYANGVATANKNISIKDLCVDGNGFVRALGTTKPSGCIFVLNAENSIIENCQGIAGPLWNLFVSSGNPYENTGHNGAVVAPSKRITIDGFTSVDPVHGDGAIIQGTWDSLINNFTSLYTATLTQSVTKERVDTGIQLIEGCRGVIVTNVMVDHGKTVTTAVGISCHANKPYMSDIVIDGVQAKGVNTCIGLFNDPSVVPVGGVTWKNRRFSIRNVHLQNPILDPSSAVMQSRLVDIQNAMNVQVENVSVDFLDGAGNYSAPTAVVNFVGCHDFSLNGVEFTNVPDVGTTAFSINRSRGWIAIADAASKRGKVSNIKLDNMGYYNRVVSDTSSLALSEIKNITVDAIPADSQAKSAVVCGSSYVSIGGIVVPVNMTLGTAGPLYIVLSKNHTDVMVSDYKMVYGGMVIRSHNPSGIQNAPGILFDRTFVSAGNSNGKGSVAFRHSAAAPGSWSVAAYNEDNNTYAPIFAVAYQPSSQITKYIAPVVDGDTNNGNASARWLNIYSVNAPQTTSDATHKNKPRDISSDEIAAFSEISRLPSVWKWLRRLEEEGDDARWHSGPTVQAAIEIMESHDLDWQKYACFCYDYSPAEAEREVTIPAIMDNDIQLIPEEKITIPAKEEVSVYSFRKEELLWWCMRALIAKQDDLEDRLSNLERMMED